LTSEPGAAGGTRGGAPLEFRRLEAKYFVDRRLRTALGRDLRALMRPDAHAGGDGSYLVRSLYLDTSEYRAYHEKLQGLAIRHKLRARVYGDPARATSVRLEVKSRVLSHIHKIAVDVPREEYAGVESALFRRCAPPAAWLEANPAAREFFRIQRQWNMEPKILIEYRREALERRELGRTRVNFDLDLRATRDLALLGELRAARPVLGCGRSIFEIKVEGRIPFWLHMLIGKYSLQNEAISKYCHAVRSECLLSSSSRADEIAAAAEAETAWSEAREGAGLRLAET
jgi:hypothetical protein